MALKTMMVFMIMSILTSSAQTDLSKTKLLGKVKSCITFDYNVTADFTHNPKFSLVTKENTVFNSDGNILIQKKYTQDTTSWRDEYINKYNDIGRLITRKNYLIHNHDTILRSESSFEYDSLGNRLKKQAYNNDSSYSYIKNTNDSLVLTGFKRQYVNNDSSFGDNSKSYKYDDNGNKIELDIMRRGYKEVIKYDTKGDITEHIHYKLDGSIDRKYVVSRDSLNNTNTTYDYISDSLINKNIVTYDEMERIIEDADYKPDGRVFKQTILYDAQGNIIMVSDYKEENLIKKTTYSYSYDKVGNWVTKSTFENDTMTHIVTQEFEYY